MPYDLDLHHNLYGMHSRKNIIKVFPWSHRYFLTIIIFFSTDVQKNQLTLWENKPYRILCYASLHVYDTFYCAHVTGFMETDPNRTLEVTR